MKSLYRLSNLTCIPDMGHQVECCSPMSVIFVTSQIIKHRKLSDDIRLYRTNNVEGGRKQEELADEQ